MSWLEFDIHGYTGMRVARRAPSAAIFRQMFQPFLAEGLEHFDLTITETGAEMESPAYAEDRYRYTSKQVFMRTGRTQITQDEAGTFHLSGKGELLTSALPIIDIILARRGAAMIHAASFEYKGCGVALPAWGGTGKTSALASLVLGVEEAAFMGDDWAFVGDDGRLLGFARPLFIKPHHRSIYPDLFERRRKPLVPAGLSAPLGRLATAVHPIVTRLPRIAAFSRRWSPEYMTVRPEQAFGKIVGSAPLKAVVFMERFGGNSMILEPREAEWMAARMIGNFYAEMSQPSREVVTALGGTAVVPLTEPFADKNSILTKALNGVPSFLLRIPVSLPTQEASRQIASRVIEALAMAGIR